MVSPDRASSDPNNQTLRKSKNALLTHTPGLRPQTWCREPLNLKLEAVEDEDRIQKQSFAGRGVKASCGVLTKNSCRGI